MCISLFSLSLSLSLSLFTSVSLFYLLLSYIISFLLFFLSLFLLWLSFLPTVMTLFFFLFVSFYLRLFPYFLAVYVWSSLYLSLLSLLCVSCCKFCEVSPSLIFVSLFLSICFTLFNKDFRTPSQSLLFTKMT